MAGQCGACAGPFGAEGGVPAGSMASRLGTSADRTVCRACRRAAEMRHLHGGLAQRALQALALAGVRARVEYHGNYLATVILAGSSSHGPDEALCVLDAADRAGLRDHAAVAALRDDLAREAVS